MGNDNGQARRVRKDVVHNQERVLQAAHELFAERGTNVTMEEVARRAGVGVGTIYRRFPSKEHLFLAVSKAACDHTHHCLMAAASAEREPLAKLQALVHTHSRTVNQQATLLAAHAEVVEPHGNDDLYRTLYSLLNEMITEGQQRGCIAQGDPAALAALCAELLSPRAFQHVQDALGDDADQAGEQVLRFILNGLRP